MTDLAQVWLKTGRSHYQRKIRVLKRVLGDTLKMRKVAAHQEQLRCMEDGHFPSPRCGEVRRKHTRKARGVISDIRSYQAWIRWANGLIIK